MQDVKCERAAMRVLMPFGLNQFHFVIIIHLINSLTSCLYQSTHLLHSVSQPFGIMVAFIYGTFSGSGNAIK